MSRFTFIPELIITFEYSTVDRTLKHRIQKIENILIKK